MHSPYAQVTLVGQDCDTTVSRKTKCADFHQNQME